MQRFTHRFRNTSWEIWLFLLLYFAFFACYFFWLSPPWRDYSSPRDFAFSGDGSVYINYSFAPSLQKFDAKGNFIQNFGGEAANSSTGSKNLNSLVTDSQGYLYASDSYNGQILKFDNRGQVVASWSVADLSPDRKCGACRLAIDRQDNLYLTAAPPVFIRKFDKTGRQLASWGSEGDGDGEFKNANSLAVDSNGQIYVSDLTNKRVQVFDNQGKFLSKWNISSPSKDSSGDRGLLTLDREGNVYIGFEYEVQKFDPTGKLLARWQPKGPKADYFDALRGLAFDGNNQLYLLLYRSSSGRIQQFDTNGHFVGQWVVGTPSWYRTWSNPVFTILGYLSGALIGTGVRRKKLYLAAKRKEIANSGSETVANTTAAEASTKKSKKWLLVSLGLVVLLFLVPIFLAFMFVGYNPLISSLLIFLIIILMGFCGLILLLVGFGVKLASQEQKKIQTANTTVSTLLPILPFDYQPLPSASYQRLIRTSFTILLVLAAFQLLIPAFFSNPLTNTIDTLATFLTDVPSWAGQSLVALVVWLVLLLFPLTSVIKGKIRHDPLVLKGWDMANLAGRLGIWVGLFLVVKLLFDGLDRLLNPPVEDGVIRFGGAISLPTIAFVAINIFLLFGGFVVVIFSWIKAAWAKCDYQTALRRAGFVRLLTFDSLLFRSLQSGTLLMAGRYNEVKHFIRESLSLTRDKAVLTQAETLEHTAQLLAGQGHYYEAIRLLEAVVKLHPKAGSAFSTLAELYLRQNLQPKRALELAEQAKKNRQKSLTVRLLEPYVWGEILATRGWALAANGNQFEAEKSLAQAFKQTGRRFRPGLASLHYRAGEIRRLQSNYTAAVTEFKKACELDLQGASGQLAFQALKSLDENFR